MMTPEPSSAGTGRLEGGGPALWDSVHARHEDVLEQGLHPLRSAPERAILRTVLERGDPRSGQVFLELGCGSSRLLPYVARETGAELRGVDFSPLGIEQTRAALDLVGAESSGIVEGTIEDYVAEHPGEADVVVSHGLVEHFDDLQEVIRWHVDASRVGGRIVITAPNLTGANLAWARRVAPSLFSWHRPVSGGAIAATVAGNGCAGVEIEYLGGPRLFAYPDPQGSHPADGRSGARRRVALVVRKLANGTGELAHRCAPRLSSRLAGARLSAWFAVAAVRDESP